MKSVLRKAPLAVALVAAMNTNAAVIEEIIVTAQKRAENVQDVPISITAFSGDELTKRGLTSMQQVSKFVPNFDMPSGNSQRNSSLRIRGIGSSGLNPETETSVGVFLDGIYMPSSAQAFGELTDIASIEVLRGPQGTLYGRNTPVGAVNVTTRKPTDDFESLLRLEVGDYDLFAVNGYVGGGISENSAGRLSFWRRDRGGFQENLLTGDPVNDYSEWGLRGKVLFTPSDTLEINLIGALGEIDKTCCVAEQIDPTGPLGIATSSFLAAQEAAGFPFNNFDDSDHKVNAVDEGSDHSESKSLSVQADWELDNNSVFTSISGYNAWGSDATVSTASLVNPLSNASQQQDNKVFSQEFRIVSSGGESLDYVAGLFYYNQETEYSEGGGFNLDGIGANRVFPFPPAFCGTPCTIQPGDEALSDASQKTESIAAYASLTYQLSDRWDVTAGARWSQDEKEASVVHENRVGNSLLFDFLTPPVAAQDYDRKEDSITWSFNTRYRFSDDALFFATAATGFKSGGFNLRRVSPGVGIEFENEDSITFEAGIKATWLDGTLVTNATIFDTTLQDFQESIIVENGAGTVVTNAGEQTVRGLEADLKYTPPAIEQLSLNASFAYLDAEYADFDSAQCGVGETPDNLDGSCDRAGETPGFSPEYQWTLGAEWEQSISQSAEIRLRADYLWTDEQNLTRATLDSPADIDAVGLLNLNATLANSAGAWELSLFVNNATDESYFVQAVRQPLGAFISGGGFDGANGVVGWYGAPRTWGLQLTLRPENF